MKELYQEPQTRCVLLQSEGTLCASVQKSFSTTPFDTIEETSIEDYWQL